MEDLFISPWQNQKTQQKPDFYCLFNKPEPNHHQNQCLKNRHIMTQQNENRDSIQSIRKFHIQIIRKKGQSLSSQNTQDRKVSSTPKKLQIKRISCPTNQKVKLRQIIARYSQKVQTSLKNQPQNLFFEHTPKNYHDDSKNQQNFKHRSTNKHFTQHKSVELIDKNQQINPFSTESRLKSRNSFKKLLKFQLSSQQNHLNRLNMTLDPIKISQKSQSKQNLEIIKHYKSIERPKLRFQRLQNANLFKQNIKAIPKLKKKNKNSFNQLEKYNLFGLRKSKKTI